MRRGLLGTLALLLALGLAACGFVANFVPPIELGDVFGIGTPDSPTTLNASAFQDPSTLGPLKPTATGATDYEATELTFPDTEAPNMHGFTLDALWVTIGLGDTITLTKERPDATYPAAFTLTGVEAFIQVSDPQALAHAVEYHFRELELDFTYERDRACANVPTCAYTTSASASDLLHAMRFTIPERDGRVVRDLITIVTMGGENTALVRARLTAEAEEGDLKGLAPTFQIMNTSTKVSLGG